MILPKLGFLTIGGSPTLAIRGASAREPWGEEERDRVLEQLRKYELEIINVKDVVFSIEEMTRVAGVLRSADVDVIVVFFTGIGEEALIPHLSVELAEFPLLLWSRLTAPRLGIMGVIHTASNLRAMGKGFSYILGDMEETETVKKFLTFARGAAVVKRIKKDIIGSLGALSPGQLDTAFEESQMRRVVADVDSLDPVELVTFFENVDEEDANKIAKSVVEEVGSCEAMWEDVVSSAKTYLALKEMVKKYRLKALAGNSRPGLVNRGIHVHLAASMLSEEGIPSHIHEHDVPAAITELVLRYLTDLPAYTGEIVGAVDMKANTIRLSHTGFSAFSLAMSRKEIRLAKFGMVKDITGKEGGVEVQFHVRPGRVTFAKLGGRLVDGELRMFIAAGEVVRPPEEMKKSGGCFAIIRPDGPVMGFLDTIISEGVEHHLLLVHGDVQAELEAFCNVLGVRKIVP